MPQMNSVMRAILGRNEKAAKPVPPTGAYANSLNWGIGRSEWDKLTYATDRLDGTSIVAAVLGWIARTFPEAPIVVKSRNNVGDFEIQDEHPLATLIESPNRWYSGVILLTATVIDWWLDGNAYWLKIRDNQLRVIELWWVPHWMIEPKGPASGVESTSENFIDHYDYRPSAGVKLEVDPADVVHFRFGLDEHNMRKGKSRFRALSREIFTDEEAARFTASLLTNMGVPGLVVSPAKESLEYSPTAEEAQATKDYIKQSFGGDHRGEALVMRGPTQVQQFGFSPEQLSLRELRRIPEERVSGVVGVAAIVAGLGAGLDRSTFANYAEAREASYEENIIPTQRIMSADIKAQLLGDFEPEISTFRVEFDTSEVRILQEDSNSKSTRLVAEWRGGVATLSEVRSRLGYDIGAEFDILALPLNADFVKVSELDAYLTTPEPVTLPAPPAALGAAPPAEEPPGNVSTLPTPQAASRRAPVKASRRRDATFLRVIERQTAKLAQRFERNLAKDYGAIGAVAEDAAFALLGSGKANDDTPSGSALYASFMAGETSADEVADKVTKSRPVTSAINSTQDDWGKSFSAHFQAVGEVVFDEVAAYLNVDMGFNPTDPRELEVIKAGGKRAKGVDISGGVNSEVRAALIEGRKAGKGPREIARSIRAEVGSTSRATTIARTETKYAQNVSSIEAYRKSDVVTGLRAFDNQTGYDDEDCTERDGKVYSFEEAESLTAEEHPNGTLSWAPVTGQE